MKKIVTLGAIAVLSAGFMFADEPAADVSITEFKGNAKVTWGMDLDAGKTGFKNTEEANFKVKLFSNGEKVTEGEGTWAELKIKTDGLKLENGEWKDGKASVDAAKLHIGKFFVDIRSGDAVVGEYKFDGAIRSTDKPASKWISNVGPTWNDNWKYAYGIQAGYDSSDIVVKADLRSLKDKDGKDTQYTNSYAIALEAGLKDSNQWLEGLFVNAGIGYNLSNEWYHKGEAVLVNEKGEKIQDGDTTYEFDTKTGKVKEVKKYKKAADTPVERLQLAGTKQQKATFNAHDFGYAFNAGYKYKLDDKYFVKPAVAFAGDVITGEWRYGDNKFGKSSLNTNDVAFGVLFGWGDNKDEDAGVPFLDGDMAKKINPGVSVVVGIPLVSTLKETREADDKTITKKIHSAVKAVIVPSFVTKGDLVEGLTAAVYSEMAVLGYKEKSGSKKNEASYTTPSLKDEPNATTFDVYNNAKRKQDTFAFALAGGVKYGIKSGDLTVTPKAGFRFANVAYVENNINGINPLSADKVFKDLGSQKTIDDDKSDDHNKNGRYAADFFNLKAGVDIEGIINNTTFSVEYASANLLNKIDYTSKEITVNGATTANPYYNGGWKWYNVKLGTLDVGCKISF